MAGRGQLTEAIQEVARGFLGREITTMELRFYSYLDYRLKNEGYLDRKHMNRDDMDVISLLKTEKHIDCYAIGSDGIYTTKEFYIFMQKILWLGYVTHEQHAA